MTTNRLSMALDRLRQATAGTKYENQLWLVGGYVRDKFLRITSASDDIDIVLEDDASELAEFIEVRGLSDHSAVTYPRFGTAMVSIDEINFELVTARRESYEAGSRKPNRVEAATIAEDARRRDFTINTLLENLHTGETVDPLGCGKADLTEGIIRTPLPAMDTFSDDPLRMLRAIRFSARFDFRIDQNTWESIVNKAGLLTSTVSGERIRDEFNKIVLGNEPSHGLTLLLESGLLSSFAPELTAMVGINQNEYHAYPVWEHSLIALANLTKNEETSPLLLRLAVLLHDCGKPSTRTVGADGRVHFFGHQDRGATLAKAMLSRLKYSHSETNTVSALVAQHMRIGEYRPAEWSDAAVRRFIRSTGPLLDWLFAIHRADVSALSSEYQDISRAKQLRERIDTLQFETDSHAMESPLSGLEIMNALGIRPGHQVSVIKTSLTDAVIDGTLGQYDKAHAIELALELHDRIGSEGG